MSDPVAIPGARDVRATLDGPRDARCLVVACPPDPRTGGSRSDARLRALSDALTSQGVACLRIDYGPWGDGQGEVTDATRAVAWAADRAERVVLAGYSFGAAVALAGALETTVAGVSAVAPPASTADIDAADAVSRADSPGQVVVGDRDTRVDSGPVVVAARARGWPVVSLPTGHGFAGQTGDMAERVAAWVSGR
ncbi:MAG: alpha/beta hydrolase [Haloferacaceae archaeon]